MASSSYSAFGLTSEGKRIIDVIDENELLENQFPLLRRSSAQKERDEKHEKQSANSRSLHSNPDNPAEAGWGYVANPNDPLFNEYIRVLERLAVHRKMADPSAPHEFIEDPEEEWEDWFEDFAKDEGKHGRNPQFMMIVGGPEQIPFRFQFLLNTYAKVGRVAFDHIDDLERFVDKILCLEQAAPTVKKETVLFGTEGDFRDPTRYSRRYMINPFNTYLEEEKGYDVTLLEKNNATKTNLVEALHASTPALVYTASHGLGGLEDTQEHRLKYNGAICCQNGDDPFAERIFSADDVPAHDIPFLEGSVFFQFACYGMGTPSESSYKHWLKGTSQTLSEYDFIAALPKRLLAHPRGPIAFIGHLDTSWVHGILDPDEGIPRERWHDRIYPFKAGINSILTGEPLGLIIEAFSKRFNMANQRLTNRYDRLMKRNAGIDSVPKKWFADNWIYRTDARDYMLFGDPASTSQVTKIQ